MIMDDGKTSGNPLRAVMQDERLSVIAKTVYAYFCSYADAGQKLPPDAKIIFDLGINRNAYYKQLKNLRDCGYIN